MNRPGFSALIGSTPQVNRVRASGVLAEAQPEALEHETQPQPEALEHQAQPEPQPAPPPSRSQRRELTPNELRRLAFVARTEGVEPAAIDPQRAASAQSAGIRAGLRETRLNVERLRRRGLPR